MKRAALILTAAASAVLLIAPGASAQPPGVDAAVLDQLCATNARTDFEYQVCIMVVHTMLAPDAFNPEPGGTYAPDGPQGAEGQPVVPLVEPSSSLSS
jgi:hypothetical protein